MKILIEENKAYIHYDYARFYNNIDIIISIPMSDNSNTVNLFQSYINKNKIRIKTGELSLKQKLIDVYDGPKLNKIPSGVQAFCIYKPNRFSLLSVGELIDYRFNKEDQSADILETIKFKIPPSVNQHTPQSMIELNGLIVISYPLLKRMLAFFKESEGEGAVRAIEIKPANHLVFDLEPYCLNTIGESIEVLNKEYIFMLTRCGIILYVSLDKIRESVSMLSPRTSDIFEQRANSPNPDKTDENDDHGSRVSVPEPIDGLFLLGVVSDNRYTGIAVYNHSLYAVTEQGQLSVFNTRQLNDEEGKGESVEIVRGVFETRKNEKVSFTALGVSAESIVGAATYGEQNSPYPIVMVSMKRNGDPKKAKRCGFFISHYSSQISMIKILKLRRGKFRNRQIVLAPSRVLSMNIFYLKENYQLVMLANDKIYGGEFYNLKMDENDNIIGIGWNRYFASFRLELS